MLKCSQYVEENSNRYLKFTEKNAVKIVLRDIRKDAVSLAESVRWGISANTGSEWPQYGPLTYVTVAIKVGNLPKRVEPRIRFYSSLSRHIDMLRRGRVLYTSPSKFEKEAAL